MRISDWSSDVCSSDLSEAYDYLVKNRGLSDLVISRFSVGYAPDGYQNLTSAFPYYGADRVLQDAGLVKKSERTGTFYDVFRDRVLFGLRDMNGQEIGRALCRGRVCQYVEISVV